MTADNRSKAGGLSRGYFGVGAENVSKPGNLGNMVRSAHAFGASFVFTVGAHDKALKMFSDTSKTAQHLPLYNWDSWDDMGLPAGCRLVGVELVELAVDLPSFQHPAKAAYVFGPERGTLSDRMQERCDHLVRIPTAFCVNVAVAAAIVMYDRVKSLGRFAPRPVAPGGAREALPEHRHGAVKIRKKTGAIKT